MDFSLDEAMRAQQALRKALDLPPESFPLPALIGMISDEIEKMRDAGRSDADISAVIEAATGKHVPAEEIVRHYAPPEERHRS